MKVETEKKIYVFDFASELFKEHIIIFLQKHIQHWDEEHAFFGIEEVINFYNDVLEDSRTVEQKSIMRRRKR